MRLSLPLTILVALLLLAAGCGDSADVDEPISPTPDPDPTELGGDATPTPTPTPTPPETETEAEATPTPTEDDQEEDLVVALDADGRVVAFDAVTGEEVRELHDGVRVDDPAANDIAVSPDGSEIYVVEPSEEPSGASQILRVPMEGGDAETVTEGTVPAISPDGAALAYVTYEEPTDVPAGHPEPVLVIRDIDGGEEVRLEREEPFYFVPDVEWTADGTQIVFTAGEIHTGLYAIERDATSLDEARRLGPDLEGDEADVTSWGPVASLDQGRLAVVERCCDVPTEERWHLISVDAADGSVEDGALSADRIEATHLDSDRQGRLVIVTGGGPDGGELLHWDGEGEPGVIAERIIVAAW